MSFELTHTQTYGLDESGFISFLFF